MNRPMTKWTLIVFVLLITPSLANTNKQPQCKIPVAPINWVLRYCAYNVGTHDEIVLQDNACFAKLPKGPKMRKQSKNA